MFPLHYEARATLAATADAVFAYFDDHKRFSSHMSRSSWMMAGSKMTVAMDTANGKEVGSMIRLQGRVLGLTLSVEEVVIERAPPFRKCWQTVGRPRLLVIGRYRMGFEIDAGGASSRARVFIDYELPEQWGSWLLGRLLGGFYARWCVDRIVADAVAHFHRNAEQEVKLSNK